MRIPWLVSKGAFLVAVLGLMALAAGVRPAVACDPLICPWDPPMHWDNQVCGCVCDCPVDPLDPQSPCGPCV
jgi:hypothetical protein